jgi:FixJ family two-component response regulator
MPRPFGSVIELQEELRAKLESLERARSTPQSLAFRCRIILRAASTDNPSNQEIAAELGCNRHTVGQWRERFAAKGLQGLQDDPRSGRPRSFSPLGTSLRGDDRHLQAR